MTLTRETKTLKVSSIRAPGDIEHVRREALTIEIAESYELTGGEPVDPIIVEAGTLRLHGGKHRFAAALNLGKKTIEALVVSGTPEQIETLCLVEQTKRRRATDAEVARLVELQHPTPADTFPEVEYEPEEDIVSPTIEPDPPLAPAKRGRPSTGKTEAVESVAKSTGRTPAAVRSAVQRATKPAPDPKVEVRCIDTLWLDVPEAVAKDAQEHVDLLDKLVRTMVAAQADLTRFSADHGNMVLRIKEPVHDAAALASMLKPDCICLYCKCTKQRKGCPGCKGRGWMTASERKAVTDERLKKGGEEAGIYVDGKWLKLSEV